MQGPDKKITIGIVEDNAIQTRMLSFFLECSYPDAAIWSVTTVRDAAIKIKDSRPMVLILDVHLGFEDCWALLAEFPYEKRPFNIISITGDHSAMTEDLLWSNKVDIVMPKPLNFESLQQNLNSLLSGLHPASLFGTYQGLPSVDTRLPIQVIQLTEETAFFKTTVLLKIGSKLNFIFKELALPMRIIETVTDPSTGIINVKAQMQKDLMTIEELRQLRRSLADLSLRSA